MMSMVMDLANAWRNVHIEIVLWRVTPGLDPFATQPHPNEGKYSLPCWKRPEPIPKPTLGQPVHLPASNILIPAPHMTLGFHMFFQRQDSPAHHPALLLWLENFCRREPELPTNGFVFSSQIPELLGICPGLHLLVKD